MTGDDFIAALASDPLHTPFKHVRVKVWRSDDPDALPDWLDESNESDGYWTPFRTARALVKRYGPTVRATIVADGVRFTLTGSELKRDE